LLDNLVIIFIISELFHHLVPEALKKNHDTKESVITVFGMWKFTTGKLPFHNRPHDQYFMLNLLNGGKISNHWRLLLKFHSELMKSCWDHNSKIRSTANEILNKYHYCFITLTKKKKSSNRKKFLSDMKNYKHNYQSINHSIQVVH
jgi:hypothetical protein